MGKLFSKFSTAVLAAALLWPLTAGSGYCQFQPAKGIVWEAPDDPTEAMRQLQAMQQTGANAVRTSRIRDNEVYSYSDRLGLDIYLDLPIERLPAVRLLDTLQYASAVLDSAIRIAQTHPSVRNIGLSRFSDTSDSTACAYFEQLVSRGRNQAPSGTDFYYTTRFVNDDQCSARVDFVLLDLVGHSNPIEKLSRWNDGGEVGVGAIGTWVRGDTLRGLKVDHSPERQARYFEEHLPPLLSGRVSPDPQAVFAYRWADQRRESPIPEYDLHSPYVARYGLHTLDGERRPALEVVSGIYTGRRTVFAFPQGTEKRRNSPWTTLLGWGIVLLLGIFYATSPRFRHMVPRYFQAHSFFLESVREGRDVLLGASAVLMASLGIASGVIFSVSLTTIRRTDAFALAVSWLSEATQETVASLLADPAIFAILAGLVYILALLVWAFILALLTKRKYGMDPSQVIMLIVWTRWPILLLLAAAMVIAVTPTVTLTAVGLLVAGWLAIEVLATARTVFDLVNISRIPALFAIPCLILHPGILLIFAAAISSLAYQPELAYLWHALTRS